jgi:mitochondrial inner membrane protease subunit 2
MRTKPSTKHKRPNKPVEETQESQTPWQKLRSAWKRALPFEIVARATGRISPSWRRFIGNTLLFTPIVGLAFLHWPYQIMHVSGSSMSPFLNPNNESYLPEGKDKILVQRLKVKPGTRLRRGDIVVFYTPHDPTKIAVKRIVGMPGDSVKPLEGYDGPDTVVVGHHQIWVEGDAEDREKSRDSNWYGPISQSLVIGRVTALLEPWWRGPRWLDSEQHAYPAKKKNRVVEDAVAQRREGKQLNFRDFLRDGNAELYLETIQKDRPLAVRKLLTSATVLSDRSDTYRRAVFELKLQDPDTVDMAQSLVNELSTLFKKAKMTPPTDASDIKTLLSTSTGKSDSVVAPSNNPSAYAVEDLAAIQRDFEARRLRSQARLNAKDAELEDYDQWPATSRYRPKAVLKAQYARRRAVVEESLREEERQLKEMLEQMKQSKDRPGGSA